MFSYNIYCYNKCLNSNETLYAKTTNISCIYIYMHLYYRISGKDVSKQSPVFGPGKSQLVTFPSGAQSPLLRIYACHTNPPVLLFMKNIINDTSTCFNVIGELPSHMELVEIPC